MALSPRPEKVNLKVQNKQAEEKVRQHHGQREGRQRSADASAAFGGRLWGGQAKHTNQRVLGGKLETRNTQQLRAATEMGDRKGEQERDNHV